MGKLLACEEAVSLLGRYPREWVVEALRERLSRRRLALREGRGSQGEMEGAVCGEGEGLALEEVDWFAGVEEQLAGRARPHLRRVINGTGVVLHTNLGRAPLALVAQERLAALSGVYANVELDGSLMCRGSRQQAVSRRLCALTGAEAALVVNNNAAAVMLALQAMAGGREVILSRGEMIEIGGSFRMPDVMEAAGVILCEVGTTNRTHLADYERAVKEKTALLLKVHRSNFALEGFTKEVDIVELVELSRRVERPLMMDQGSGLMFSLPQGWPQEWSIPALHAAGVEMTTWSGDKLLGGPQCGILTGRARWIERAAKLPLARAFRVDKLTLAALEATLQIYEQGEAAVIREIPIWSALRREAGALREEAERYVARWKAPLAAIGWHLAWLEGETQAGGGALPTLSLPTFRLSLHAKHLGAQAIASLFRNHTVPVLGLIERECFLLDLRTLLVGDLEEIDAILSHLPRASSGMAES